MRRVLSDARRHRAAAYNLNYRQRLLKRKSTQREFDLIGRHVARIGRSRIILDLPCGGSRLTPAFADSADLVIEADIAHGQLLFRRAESSVATPRVWMTASAFHIPLRDASVDGTFCVRLSHHLPTAAEREQLLTELLRVSRRFVVMTYFDHHSLKNVLRRLRRPFDRQPPKMTMTTARVAEFAREHGACTTAAYRTGGSRRGTSWSRWRQLRRPRSTSSTCRTAASSRRASPGPGWRPSTRSTCCTGSGRTFRLGVARPGLPTTAWMHPRRAG